jgi:hypothetical protein
MIYDLLKNLNSQLISIEFIISMQECGVWFGLVGSKTFVIFFLFS